ncbi:ATP-binding protein [uncultured Bacteroides sp.]|uniref:hybrid sensor histidine kinase/response regulator transcription factor n=1 Tax=uncultured Bacteroides sp. TaxID=162156 RepID=UPI00260CF871|nr:ATP-binding protein [uncultured Bacteroides sp.]
MFSPLTLFRTIVIAFFFTYSISTTGTNESHLNWRQFKSSHLGINNGLSSTRIYSILEANDGSIWIGTKLGIERYNGAVVKSYLLPSSMPISDGGGHTIKLTKDEKGNIFAYDNKRKIAVYNPALDNFELLHDLTEQLSSSAVTYHVYIDADATLWIGCDKGLYQLKPDNRGKWIIKDTSINFICKTGTKLMVATNNGVQCVQLQNNKCSNVFQCGMVQTLYYDDTTNRLWVGKFYGGMHILDMSTMQEIPMATLSTLPPNPVRSIVRMNSKTILIGIDGAGVYASNNDGSDIWSFFNADENSENTINSNGVYDICIDRHNNLWIGSYTGGVDIAYPFAQVLEEVRHKYNDQQSLINDNVNDIFESADGMLWYATDRGVSIYNPTTRHWCHALYDKVVLTLCQGHGNEVLAGTFGNGVFAMNTDGKSRQVYTKDMGILKSNFVFLLKRDADGDLWMGCLDGNLVHVNDDKTDYYPIQQVQTIENMPDGRLAVGTCNGLYIIDKHKNEQLWYFNYGESTDNTDLNHFIQSLLFADNNNVWIATDGGGLYLYNLQSEQILKNINTGNGLPSNTVYALGRDRNGRIIASTDHGLAFVHADSDKVINVNFISGLDRDYKRVSMDRLRDGRFIIGSSTGAVIIWPEKINQLSYEAKLNITGIKVNNANDGLMLKLYDMLQDNNVHLSYGQSTFDIFFESIYYKYQNDIVYQYRLDNFDSDWNIASSAQYARYTNLPPGSYSFCVRSVSRNDGRVLDEKVLKLSVAQPWWNSLTAWLLYLCTVAVIAYFAWAYYKEKLQQRYFDEKIKFFTNTAHDIRTPLSLVLAPLSDMAKDQTLSDRNRKFLQIACENGDKLLGLFTQLLDFQKSDCSKVTMYVRKYDLKTLLLEQIAKFHPMAIQKHLQLQLEKCPDNQSVWMDGSMTEKIFENLLSNAIKYTPEGGSVNLSAWTDSNNIYINVADTGIGIPKSAHKHIFQSYYRAENAVNTKETGSGLGLMLTRKLVERHQGKLSFESNENQGSNFLITLRKGNSHLDMTHSTEDEGVQCACKQEKTNFENPDADNTNDSPDTVLFVDDSEELRNYVRMRFTPYYNIIDMASAEEALDFLQNGGICDIIVSDAIMPGMHGDELCRRIKENDETAWIPVILLTGKTDRDFMIEGFGKGADDFLTKPFDSAVLRIKISSILENHRRLSHYYMNHMLTLVKEGNVPQEPAATQQMSKADCEFIERATHIVINRITDTDFDIDEFCKEMAMSRTSFYGRLKSLTSQTPQEFIRLIRLERAALLLKQGESVLDVSVKTGFVNAKYFSTLFKKHFGTSPSRYR